MAAPLEFVDHAVGQSFRALVRRVEDHVGRLRRLVGLVDAGEILDLAGERALVQALRVARDDGLERRLDENLDELARRDEIRARAAARRGTAR